MPKHKTGYTRTVTGVILSLAFLAGAAHADEICTARQTTPQVPVDKALCASLSDAVRKPSALPLPEYEKKFGDFLRNYCHRDTDSGWVRDKRVRDTGPFVAALKDGVWQGSDHAFHSPVVIWYSPEAFAWIRANRSEADGGFGSDKAPMPDGAMLIKEMYPAPASRCADVDPLELQPTSGAAIMVRDSKASHDGWFWGWFGWAGWDADWPADPKTNRPPYMGFGQYCVNCHASARDNLTFSSARNIQGEPGIPQTYLIQDEAVKLRRSEAGNPAPASAAAKAPEQVPHHIATKRSPPSAEDANGARTTWLDGFVDAFPSRGGAPQRSDIPPMPSETYDNVWMPGEQPA